MTATMTKSKKISITVELPAHVLQALDSRAKALGFTREKLLADLLQGASELMAEMTSAKGKASIPITIGFRPKAVRAYGDAARILRTTPQALIGRSLEIGEQACRETAERFEREQEDTKVH